MTKASRTQRIHDLNRQDQLNRVALSCLVGYCDDDHSELALLTLTELWWEEGLRPAALAQYGAAQDSEITSTLAFLRRAEPEDALAYMTELAGRPAWPLESLRQLDGEGIAGKVITLIAYKLALGLLLRSSQVNAST